MSMYLGLPVWRKPRPVLLMMAIGMATGCSAVEGLPVPPSDVPIHCSADEVYAAAAAADRSRIRDAIVYRTMESYDQSFYDFQRSLYSSANIISTGSGLTALTLSSLGATVASNAAKTAFATAAAGVVGANAIVNKELFYEKTVPALVAQMQATRAHAKKAIFEGLKLDDVQYSLGRACQDLNVLREAASLGSAIATLTQTTETSKQQAQAALVEFTRNAAYEDWIPTRNALLGKVSALTSAQALKLVATLEPTIAESPPNVRQALANRDPGGVRKTNGGAAMQYISTWLILTAPLDAATQKKVNDAIVKATQ